MVRAGLVPVLLTLMSILMPTILTGGCADTAKDNASQAEACDNCVDPDIPAPTGLTTLAVSSGTVSLGWIFPAGSAGLEVILIRSQTDFPSDVTQGTEVYRGTSTNYTDSGLTNGMTYYALFTRDNQNHFAPTSVTTTATPVMPPPTAFTITPSGTGSVTLNWSNPTDPNFGGVVVTRDTGGTPASPFAGSRVRLHRLLRDG